MVVEMVLRNFRKNLGIITLTLSAGSVAAQVDGKVTLQREGFKEFLHESANISGAVVAGLQRHGTGGEGISLGAFVPADWAGSNACMQVVSIDGRYEAYGPYTIPKDWNGGLANLEFPTEHFDALQKIPQDGLGAMLSEGECAVRGSGGISVALWNTEPDDTVYLMVNSFRADRVFLYLEGVGSPTICERLNLSSPIAFDTKCRLSLEEGNSPTEVELYRVSDGQPSKPTHVSIWLPVSK